MCVGDFCRFWVGHGGISRVVVGIWWKGAS